MASQTAKARPAKPATQYKEDLYTWRAGRLSEVDALSDVGSEIYFRLESSFAVPSQHLLNWDHQPQRRSRSWQITIREQRRRIARLLKKNPGLKPEVPDALSDGYDDGRDRALVETRPAESSLPKSCPYTFDEMMTRVIVIE